MAAAFNATATQAAAYQTVMMQKVATISTVEFTYDSYLELHKTILAASTKVPSPLAGGEDGHSYLVLNEADLKEYTGKDLVQAKTPKPDLKPNIVGNDSNATISLKTHKKAIELNTYFTQEGVESGLRDLIVKSVPKAIITELKHRQFGFAKVTLLQLLEKIKDEAEPTDIISLNDLLQEREEQIDFEGEQTLKEFFKDIDEVIKKLDKDHDIDTSFKLLTAKYLLQIERHGGDIFRSHLTTWRAKPKADKTWDNFKQHWCAADKERRKTLKLNIESENKDSAHNVQEDAQQQIDVMFAAGMTSFADAAEESIHAAIEKKFEELTNGNTGGGGNKNDTKTDDNASIIEMLRKEIKALRNKLKSGGDDVGSDNKTSSGYPKCGKCGWRHKGGEKECWHKKENSHKAPWNQKKAEE